MVEKWDNVTIATMKHNLLLVLYNNFLKKKCKGKITKE